MLKKFLKTISLYTIFLMIEKILSVLFFSYIAHTLSMNDMGEYGLYMTIYVFLSFLLSLEFKSGYARYYYEYSTEESRYKLFCGIVNVTFLSHVIMGILLLCIINYFNLLSWKIFIALSILSFSDSLIYLIQYQKRLEEKDMQYGVIIISKILLTIIFYFIIKNYDIGGSAINIIYAMLFSSTIVSLVSYFSFFIKGWLFSVNYHIIKNSFLFSIKIAPGIVGSYLSSLSPQFIIDKVFLNREFNGIFSVYQKIASTIYIMFDPLYIVFSQRVLKFYKEKNFIGIYKMMLNIIFNGYGFMMCIFILGSYYVVYIFAGEKYIEYQHFLFIFLFSGYCTLISRILELNIQISEKNHYFSYLEIFVGVLSVSSLLLCAYYFDFYFFIYCIAVISFFRFVVYMIVSKKIYPKLFLGYFYYLLFLFFPSIIYIFKIFDLLSEVLLFLLTLIFYSWLAIRAIKEYKSCPRIGEA